MLARASASWKPSPSRLTGDAVSPASARAARRRHSITSIMSRYFTPRRYSRYSPATPATASMGSPLIHMVTA
jgi:hypothetical protein